MLKKSPEAEDVQHFVFDDIHDGCPWELFLLSYLLHRLSNLPSSLTKIYLMSATFDTRIFQVIAVLKQILTDTVIIV